MKKILFLVLLTGLFNHSYAQQANSKSTATNTVAKDEKPSPLTLYSIPMKMWLLNTTTIKGQKISYKATTGTMPVWDEDGKRLRDYFILIMNVQMSKIVLHH
jgi:carboxypeptidase C (cathepsin A)